MNLLLEPLPTAVEVGGFPCAINSDFRAWIRFETQLLNGAISQGRNFFSMLQSLFPEGIPDDVPGMIDAVLWFYHCGKESRGTDGRGRAQARLVYSYDQDDLYIYAAFLSQYRIDLNTIESLHWWKFKALFESLHSENKIVEIMGYRGMEIPKGASPEQKDFYNKMKKLYEIPLPRTEQAKNDALVQALLNGEDLTGLV